MNKKVSKAKAYMRSLAGENHPLSALPQDAPAAVCRNGTFVGKQEGDVQSFLGIPYAVPPTGPLRWKDPVPVKDVQGMYEAYYYGKSPIQTEWPSEVGSFYPQGEDCLRLNVWTNKAGPKSGKTVMVFFHGGSYGWGATSDPIYDGHNLVLKFPDLVLVTVGYRTGILGFIDLSEVPGGEEYQTSGNLGLLDQACALAWVHENIGAFGGDPENVTIFGESAGGGSASLLPLMKETRGLFKRTIAQSGSVALTYSREECKKLTGMLLKHSKCKSMKELASLSEADLVKLNERLNDFNNFPERDGVVLPVDLYQAWEDPALAHVDLMTGTNADESRYWINEMGYYVPFVPGSFLYKHGSRIMYENNLLVMSEEEKRAAKAFIKKKSGEPAWRVTEYNNEVLFRLPSAETALRHARAGGRSYVYYWTMPGADPEIGACHAIELSYVFNNPHVDIYTGGLYNERLADMVQRMWVSFARCGDPGTEDLSWDAYTPQTRQTMILGPEIHLEADPGREDRELLEPLLGHYFNGCYSQLDMNVPQTRRILFRLAVIVGFLLLLFLLWNQLL